MKRYALFLSLKNFLIAVVVIVLSIEVAELFLVKNSGQKEEEVNLRKEQSDLLMMCLERTPEEALVPLAQWFHLSRLEATAANKTVYPLIRDLIMPDEIYDEDTVTIVVVGDSFVWGAYSTNRNELFWRLLENDLRMQGYNCRVYGVGLGVTCSYDELQWLTDSSLIEDLDPDILIIGYVQNDPVPDTEDLEKRLFRSIDTRTTTLVPPWVRQIIPNISNRLSTYLIAKAMYNDELVPDGSMIGVASAAPVLKGSILKRYTDSFVKPLNDFAAQSGFPIAVMTLPPYPDNMLQKALYAPLHALYAAYENIAFYDCLPDLCDQFADKKHEANYFVNSIDDHPGSATNRFYADYIESFLKRDYPDLLGKSRKSAACDIPFFINECMPAKLDLQKEYEDDEKQVYSFSYPSSEKVYDCWGVNFDKYFLRYPLGTNHVKLSFSLPTAISSAEISGERCTDIDLYYGRINESLNYDDHAVYPCGNQTESGVFWTNEDRERITSFYIHCGAGAENGDRLTLTIRK